ncbi:MAG: hypothetical protein NVSMB27_06270 [Ktedonobacteraceae bacterium]
MSEKKLHEAALNVVKTLQEASETIAESAVAAQERNVKYAQSTIAQSVDLLKNQADNTLALMQTFAGQPEKEPVGFQATFDQAVAAQEQYLKFAQNTVVNGLEILKSHAESTQALFHELEERARKQQKAFQVLVHESSEAYMDYFRIPLTYYRKALDAVETATRQGLETFEKATETFQKSSREGLEAFQKYAHQVQHDTQEATK